MRSSIIIFLLSTLPYWGQAAPQHGMFPLVQTVYNNRAPSGFFYFPSWQSMMAHMERDNNLANFREAEANSPVTVTAAETMYTSPGYDGNTKYATELDEVSHSNIFYLSLFQHIPLISGGNIRGRFWKTRLAAV